MIRAGRSPSPPWSTKHAPLPTSRRSSGTQIVVDIPENLPNVVVDRIMIEQVLLNLVKNGIEAMNEGTPSTGAACSSRPGW